MLLFWKIHPKHTCYFYFSSSVTLMFYGLHISLLTDEFVWITSELQPQLQTIKVFHFWVFFPSKKWILKIPLESQRESWMTSEAFQTLPGIFAFQKPECYQPDGNTLVALQTGKRGVQKHFLLDSCVMQSAVRFKIALPCYATLKYHTREMPPDQDQVPSSRIKATGLQMLRHRTLAKWN